MIAHHQFWTTLLTMISTLVAGGRTLPCSISMAVISGTTLAIRMVTTMIPITTIMAG